MAHPMWTTKFTGNNVHSTYADFVLDYTDATGAWEFSKKGGPTFKLAAQEGNEAVCEPERTYTLLVGELDDFFANKDWTNCTPAGSLELRFSGFYNNFDDRFTIEYVADGIPGWYFSHNDSARQWIPMDLIGGILTDPYAVWRTVTAPAA